MILCVCNLCDLLNNFSISKHNSNLFANGVHFFANSATFFETLLSLFGPYHVPRSSMARTFRKFSGLFRAMIPFFHIHGANISSQRDFFHIHGANISSPRDFFLIHGANISQIPRLFSNRYNLFSTPWQKYFCSTAIFFDPY